MGMCHQWCNELSGRISMKKCHQKGRICLGHWRCLSLLSVCRFLEERWLWNRMRVSRFSWNWWSRILWKRQNSPQAFAPVLPPVNPDKLTRVFKVSPGWWLTPHISSQQSTRTKTSNKMSSCNVSRRSTNHNNRKSRYWTAFPAPIILKTRRYARHCWRN